MVQHAGSKACLLDDAIHVEQRANPAQVHVERPHGPPPEHDAGVGGEVANRVEDLAHHLGLAVELLDARIDDLDRRGHVLGRREHVEQRRARPLQRPAEDERELDLDPRRDEATCLDVGALREEHVVHQRREIGLGDL